MQAQPEEEETKKLTRTQDQGKRTPKEVLKQKREQDRIPFRKAGPEEEREEEDQSTKGGMTKKRGREGRPQGMRKQRRRSGEDTPLTVASAGHCERYGDSILL